MAALDMPEGDGGEEGELPGEVGADDAAVEDDKAMDGDLPENMEIDGDEEGEEGGNAADIDEEAAQEEPSEVDADQDGDKEGAEGDAMDVAAGEDGKDAMPEEAAASSEPLHGQQTFGVRSSRGKEAILNALDHEDGEDNNAVRNEASNASLDRGDDEPDEERGGAEGGTGANEVPLSACVG
jgi:hypothetical protein